MKINLFTKILLMLSLAAGFTSCGDDDNDNEEASMIISSPEAMTLVYSAGEATVSPGGQYKIAFKENSRTADLYVSNVTIVDDKDPVTMVVRDLPCQPVMLDGAQAYKIDVASAKADEVPVHLSDIDIMFAADAKVGDNTYSRMAVSYTMDSRYKVSMLPMEMTCTGRTATTNGRDGSIHTSDRMVYRIVMHTGGRKADLYVANADFAAGMPALGEMKFADVDVNYSDDSFTFSSRELIPSIGGVPSPNRLVTNLTGTVELDELDNNVSISFDCMTVFTVKAELDGNYFPNLYTD